MAHRGRRGGKTIDTVHWTGFSQTSLAAGAGSVAATLAAAQHLPETLLRIRGEWSAWNDGTGTVPGDAVIFACGIIQVPEGTSTTVLWSPLTDQDAPWIWWDGFTLAYEESVTDVIADQQMMSGRRVIDSKAMRKIRNTELQVVWENITIGTGMDVNSSLLGRILSGS